MYFIQFELLWLHLKRKKKKSALAGENTFPRTSVPFQLKLQADLVIISLFDQLVVVLVSHQCVCVCVLQ